MSINKQTIWSSESKMDAMLHEHEVYTWRKASENFIFRLERLLRYDGIENTVLSRDESWKPAMTVRRRLVICRMH